MLWCQGTKFLLPTGRYKIINPINIRLREEKGSHLFSGNLASSGTFSLSCIDCWGEVGDTRTQFFLLILPPFSNNNLCRGSGFWYLVQDSSISFDILYLVFPNTCLEKKKCYLRLISLNSETVKISD